MAIEGEHEAEDVCVCVFAEHRVQTEGVPPGRRGRGPHGRRGAQPPGQSHQPTLRAQHPHALPRRGETTVPGYTRTRDESSTILGPLNA